MTDGDLPTSIRCPTMGIDEGARMDVDRFDSWTRDLIGRRSALGLLLGAATSVTGSASSVTEAKNKKKRCRKSDRDCTKDKQCCGKLTCADSVCCPPERYFVNCPPPCLCPDDDTVCCAYIPDPPTNCGRPADAPQVCCAPENICGDFCCNPDAFSCNLDTQKCECILPDPLDCPSGGGGFVRVRHVR
jgi:hypothetical protein